MKTLTVIAAGLGFETLERAGKLRMAGLNFSAADSVFPALTCTAQASFRTGTVPALHGMTSNGYYSRTLRKPMFWEQSSSLVHGKRIWEDFRKNGDRVGLYFWQQSLGENVDQIISPAPIHKHGGGMIMRNYTQPKSMSEELNGICGTFPLFRYWGPLASPKVGLAVIKNFIAMEERHQTDHAYLYLPTLDYEAQRYGPDSAASRKALVEFESQLKMLGSFAGKHGAKLSVMGDYEISSVSMPPAFPNMLLRKSGFFKTRPVAGHAYPDFYTSRAFAMCDHEIAHVYVTHEEDVSAVAKLFEETGEYESVEIRANQAWAHESAGEILLLAKKGSWCAYQWWTNDSEAPDWATHVDIHNKPGYDPSELFFGGIFPPKTSQDPHRIKGTHARQCKIAIARDF